MEKMSKGPIYNVELLDILPLGDGPMKQALPTAGDLRDVMEVSQRTVAGYEVLLAHYYRQSAQIKSLLIDRGDDHATTATIDTQPGRA